MYNARNAHIILFTWFAHFVSIPFCFFLILKLWYHMTLQHSTFFFLLFSPLFLWSPSFELIANDVAPYLVSVILPSIPPLPECLPFIAAYFGLPATTAAPPPPLVELPLNLNEWVWSTVSCWLFEVMARGRPPFCGCLTASSTLLVGSADWCWNGDDWWWRWQLWWWRLLCWVSRSARWLLPEINQFDRIENLSKPKP